MNLTLPILKGLQSAYNAIPVKDPNKIYITTDSGRIYLGETNIGSADIGRVVRNIAFNETTQVFTITYTDDTTDTVDLVLESVIKDIDYADKKLTITLVSGDSTTIDLTDLIDIYTGGDTDSATVDVDAGEIFVDVKISETSGNAITVEEDGLYVKTPYGDTTDTVVTTVSDGKVSANVKVSAETDNIISTKTDGIYVKALVGDETDTSISAISDGKVLVDVKVSSEDGNAITFDENGLYAATPYAVSDNLVVGTGSGITDSGKAIVSAIEDSTSGTDVPDVAAIKGVLAIGTF